MNNVLLKAAVVDALIARLRLILNFWCSSDFNGAKLWLKVSCNGTRSADHRVIPDRRKYSRAAQYPSHPLTLNRIFIHKGSKRLARLPYSKSATNSLQLSRFHLHSVHQNQFSPAISNVSQWFTGSERNSRYPFPGSDNGAIKRRIPDRMQCGIVEITYAGRGQVYPCSETASGQCSDCGIPVCKAHSDTCNLCNQRFCATCLSFHEKDSHGKRQAQPVPQPAARRRR
jgi:hypothetical protein